MFNAASEVKMITPPLASPDSLLSQKSLLSMDSTATSHSSNSSSSATTASSGLFSPPVSGDPTKADPFKAVPPNSTASPSRAIPTPAALAAAAAAAKRRRAQTDVQRLPIRLPLKPSGMMTGNMASYGNAVTQLVPPRKMDRRMSVVPYNDMAGAKGEADAITGRRRIQIGYITNETRRASTFKKRKAGLLKKAYELAELTGSHVLVVAVNDQGKCYSFATPSLQPMVAHQEGQTLLKRCLANGQTSNDSTAFHSGQGGEPSAFGVVESIPDDDDDEDDDDDDDSDADIQPLKSTSSKNGAAASKVKAVTLSPPSTVKGTRGNPAGLTINTPAANFNANYSTSGQLTPVFLNKNGNQAQGSVNWQDARMSDDAHELSGPPNLAPAHILAFDQAAAAHQQMMGMLSSTDAKFAASSQPIGGPSMDADGTRAAVRTGRQRAATMLNPIELQPLPSDNLSLAGLGSTAATAFSMGSDLPSPVNALALNLGSAYIGAGDGKMADGNMFARTFEVQAAGVGRPRALTTFPMSSAPSAFGGIHAQAMNTSLWPFDSSLLQTAQQEVPLPDLSSQTESATLGKRKSGGLSAGSSGSGSHADTFHAASLADAVMQQEGVEEDGPRKMARKQGATSPGTADVSMHLMGALDPAGASSATGAHSVPGSGFVAQSRAFGRTRSHTVGHALQVGMDDLEPGMMGGGGNLSGDGSSGPSSHPTFSPAFLYTPDPSTQQQGFFHPSNLSSSSSFIGVDTLAAGTGGGMLSGLDAYATTTGGGAVSGAAAAPRTMVTPHFGDADGATGTFPGLMMGGIDSSSSSAGGSGPGGTNAAVANRSGNLFEALHFAGLPPSQAAQAGAGTALGKDAAAAATSSSVNNSGGAALMSPPLMTASDSCGSFASSSHEPSAATAATGAGTQPADFLHRLQQQQLHQQVELERQYAELSAAASAAAAAAAAASVVSTGGRPQ